MPPVEVLVTDSLDAELECIPNQPAVFVVHASSGRPYLARTAALRRRLKRLLGYRTVPGRLLYLRDVAVRVQYWMTPSRLSASLLHYELARQHFPDDYTQQVKLRWPSYVRLVLSNAFPRTMVTTRLGGVGVFFGPFRNRVAAEEFEQGALDYFQVRRCQEDLVPSAEHPGCLYGEMNRCLRPCQLAVTAEEYASEVARLHAFLDTGGASLVHSITSARDRWSEELEFEEAARQQARLQRLEQILAKGEAATEITKLSGVAVLSSMQPAAVDLRFLLQGAWLPAVEFSAAPAGADMIPMDRRLRELAAALAPPKVGVRTRQEHMALLARWRFSTAADGEWLAFESLEKLPYRRLVNAISRQVRAAVVS